MNEYKITYSYAEGATEIATVIERNESAARKDFKSHYKDGTILDVELSAENVPATKQQERDTLAAIEKMVKELGPDSYVATAFEGCFAIAEMNIDCDAADNLQERIEHLDEIRVKTQAKLAEANETIAALEQERDKLREVALPRALRDDLAAFLHAEREMTTRNMTAAADMMAAFAEAPQDIAFTNAVKSYRVSKERREWCDEKIASLGNIGPSTEQ